MQPRRKVRFLIVEDDPNDILLLERMTMKAGGEIPPSICVNGEEAIKYLQGAPPYQDRRAHPFPQVVITDIKMPVVSGLELLKWMKENGCRIVPTIVMSSSAQPEDVKRAYELGASAYFQKPVSSAELLEIFKSIFSYWERPAVPPPPPRCG